MLIDIIYGTHFLITCIGHLMGMLHWELELVPELVTADGSKSGPAERTVR